tara:strand:+ start:146 stop:313 length:168 start_codon:yes stop_codon:yes gene_type:complete
MNLSNDWDSFWEECSNCGVKYHASEGCQRSECDEKWFELMEKENEESEESEEEST